MGICGSTSVSSSADLKTARSCAAVRQPVSKAAEKQQEGKRTENAHESDTSLPVGALRLPI